MDANKLDSPEHVGTAQRSVLFPRPLTIAWLLLSAGALWPTEYGAAMEAPPLNHAPLSEEPGELPKHAGFLDVTAALGLEGMSNGEAAWGDFNNDGWVDFCAGGQVWRNEQGQRFVKIADLPGSALWGDFDNDDRLRSRREWPLVLSDRAIL